MSYKGVKTAKVLSVILAAAMLINSTQTACASSQAAFDVASEDLLLLEEAGAVEEESISVEAPSDEENLTGDEEPIDDEHGDHETVDEGSVEGEFQASKDNCEEIVLEEAQEPPEEVPVVELDDLQAILEEEIFEKLGDEELEAAEEITLTEEEIEVKSSLIENEVLSDLLEMEEGKDYLEDQVIALASDNEEAELIAKAYGGELTDFSYGIATISLKDSELSVLEAFEYGINPETNVPAVEPDYLLSFDGWDNEDADDAEFESWEEQYYNLGHNDPLFNPADSSYQWHHEAIGCFDAWDVSLGSSDITVAVIDSGVQTDHEDLVDAIVDNYEQVNKDTAAMGLNDNNEDGYGHGTHVAGLIAASIGNGKGGAGVAPGAKLLPLNVCKPSAPGSPVVSYMVKAIQYVSGAVDVNKATYYTQRRADIINLSIGSNTYNAAMKTAVDAAYAQGVTIVAAMGNDGSNLVKYPAIYNHVIGVCATRKDNTLANFSDYGDWADISAPGTGIYSCSRGTGNTYGTKDGTSMSSPIVAGACALYMSYRGHVSPDEMEKALKTTATKTSQSGTGAGVVNVAKMLGKSPSSPKPGSANSAVKTMTLNHQSKTISDSAAGIPESLTLTINSLVDEKGNDLLKLGTSAYYTFKWTSSNPDVAAISGATQGMGLTSVPVIPISSGAATVTCQVLDNSGKKATCKIKVVGDKAITAISFGSYQGGNSITTDSAGRIKSAALFVGAASIPVSGDGDDEVIILEEDTRFAEMILTVTQSTRDGDLDNFIKAPIFKNSNPKAVKLETIDESGKTIKITALAKGSAKITATAADGSKKSTSITIVVNQPVTSLEITGQAYVQAGSKASYKAQVLPSDAGNKKVTWEVGEYVDSGSPLKPIANISVNEKGEVYVGANASYSDSICVRAVSEDNSSISAQTFFNICKKCEYVSLYRSNGTTSGDWTTMAPVKTGKYDRSVTLIGAAYVSGDKIGKKVAFTSSNPKVVSVDECVYDSDLGKTTATLVAHTKGKVTITCSALDGSKKSSKVNLNVIIPATGLALTMKNNQSSNTVYGATTVIEATVGKALGTPGNSKVDWDYDIVAYRLTGGSDRLSNTDPELLREIKRTKSFFEFSKGKIKVNKKDKFEALIDKYGYDDSGKQIYGDFGLVANAVTADGSGFYKESSVIRAIDPATYIKFTKYDVTVDESGNKSYTLEKEATTTIVIDLADENYNPTFVSISHDSDLSGSLKNVVSINSSNPSVASAYCGSHTASGISGLIIYPYKTGESKITATLRDSSGMKRVLKIKVINTKKN